MKSNTLNASYLKPTSVKEAADLKLKGFHPVGGGTDIIVRNHALRNSDAVLKKPLFSCCNISETRLFEIKNNRLTIGSSVTISEIIQNPHCPEILRKSLLCIASPGIRNIATLAGNICNASPAADSLPALYLLDTKLTLQGHSSKRQAVLSDFITGPGRTILADDEIVLSISFDLNDSEFFFRKVGTRAANALSKLTIAALYEKDGDVFNIFTLAIGACAPTIIRCREAEELIEGFSSTDIKKKLDDIIRIYEAKITPIDDQRSTATYRKNTALRLIKNLLLTGAEQ